MTKLPAASNLEIGAPSRTRRVLLWAAILVALGGIGFGGWTIRNRMRAHKAEVIAEGAKQLGRSEVGRLKEAVEDAVEAYNLAPDSPEVVRTMAELSRLMGSHKAVYFYERLGEMGAQTAADRRDLLECYTVFGYPREAENLAAKMLQADPGDAAVLGTMGKFHARSGEMERALAELRRAADADPEDPEYPLYVAALELSAGKLAAEDQRPRWRLLFDQAQDDGETGLTALNLIADLRQVPPGLGDDLVRRLRDHPLGDARHKTLALNWELRLHPDDRDALIAREMRAAEGASFKERADLALWMNGQGAYAETLRLLSLTEVKEHPALFTAFVEASAQIHGWGYIGKLLAASDLPIEGAVKHLFNAHQARETGDTLRFSEQLRKAAEVAYREDKRAVLEGVGRYAEAADEWEIAQDAYDRLVSSPDGKYRGLLGRMRVAEHHGDTLALLDAAKLIALRYQRGDDWTERLAYWRLIIGAEVEVGAAEAERLRASGNQPKTLLIAGLAKLRFGDRAGAGGGRRLSGSGAATRGSNWRSPPFLPPGAMPISAPASPNRSRPMQRSCRRSGSSTSALPKRSRRRLTESEAEIN
ncbi:MAG: tetratricopeptide repeat protein [Verrucomicrobiales bacterium]